MDEWRPIDTVPKDGTEFLAYDADAGKMDVCIWDSYGYLTQVQFDAESGPFNGEFGYDRTRITHWMPLPPPPTPPE